MADTSFADAFIHGREMRKQHERQKKLDEEARGQRELGNQITARNIGLQDLELAKSMPAPVEQLPAGQQGPPQTLEQLITIPGVKALGIGDRQVKPTYQTDINIQNRAQEDLKQSNAIERLRAELGLRQEADIAGEQRQQAAKSLKIETPEQARYFNAKIGDTLTPTQQEAAKTIQTDDRQREATRISAAGVAEGRAARQDAKQREIDAKKAEKEQDAMYFARRLHSGEIAIDEIPDKLAPSAGILAEVLGRQQPGRVFASKKDRESYKGLGDAADQAQGLLDNFNPAAVGPLDTKLPTLKGKTAYYEAQIAGMFNELGKLRSGGAITPQEYDRLSQEIPKANDFEDVFKAKAQRFIDEMRKRQGGLVVGGQKAAGVGGAPGGAQPGNEAAAAQALIDKYR